MYEKLKFIMEKFVDDKQKILEAFEFSFYAHRKQKREDGTSYIVHPLEVAYILSDMNLDINTVIGGFLHDVIEDTEFTCSDIQAKFGEEIAILVEGVSKLDKIDCKTKEEAQAKNIRKILVAMTKDIRVILIKLADRLHNMRTLKYLSKEKQIEKAKETMNIFVPLAHRLGISKIKWELEDLSFKYLNPDEYREIASLVLQKRGEREKFTNCIIEEFKKALEESNIVAIVEGRAKNLYSIYKKIAKKSKTIDEIFDLIAIRVIVDDIKSCYLALGLAHEMYRPISNKFKDYIAMPKSNNYQSLHTTVLSSSGKCFEIQIRTKQMHKIAEIGIAAHFKYKEQQIDKDDFDDKFVWIREVVEWLTETENPKEAVENFKIDLAFQEIFVFTPKGRVICLPVGSTPVDFAFRIHTDVGYKCEGAKVNGKMVALDFELETGNVVEILTSKKIEGPRLDWLNFVKSNHAKSKIRQWFNRAFKVENILKGKYLLEKECKRRGIKFDEFFNHPNSIKFIKTIGFSSNDNLFSVVGIDNSNLNPIINKISDFIRNNKESNLDLIDNDINVKFEKKLSNKSKENKKSSESILVKGEKNLLNRFAKCCTPVYGDEIIGFVTRGRGVTIHRKQCKNMMKCDDVDRIIELEWDDGRKDRYDVDICVFVKSVNSSTIDCITSIVRGLHIVLKSMNFKGEGFETHRIDLRINIDSKRSLDSLLKSLKNIKGCVDVFRPNAF